MTPALSLVESGPLPYLLSVPAPVAAGRRPLLCFLHGYDEGAPMPIRQGLCRHGPLSPGSSPLTTAEFVVVAPQLPIRGDIWHRFAEEVDQIVAQVQERHGTDPERSYLTGFSFGGNGVFDLASVQPETWAALWAVDPTRVPPEDPGRPAWLSSGEVSRGRAAGFIRRLGLEPAVEHGPGDRVYEDRGLDHVGTASSAYRDEAIYRWLLSKRRSIDAGE